MVLKSPEFSLCQLSGNPVQWSLWHVCCLTDAAFVDENVVSQVLKLTSWHCVVCSRCWVHWAGPCSVWTRLTGSRTTILCCTKSLWTLTLTTACSSLARHFRTLWKNCGHFFSSSCHTGTASVCQHCSVLVTWHLVTMEWCWYSAIVGCSNLE